MNATQPRPQRERLPEVERPTLSINGQTNGCDDSSAISWHRYVEGDSMAKELINLQKCSHELEQYPWMDLPTGFIQRCEGSEVEHAGQGVFIQNNQHGIDPDSRLDQRTITTVETRTFSSLCLETTMDPRNTPLVLGTGQPQIGKSRGPLAFTLQELLWRGEAVMRVGYKDNVVCLFLPQPNGQYEVWKSKADLWLGLTRISTCSFLLIHQTTQITQERQDAMSLNSASIITTSTSKMFTKTAHFST